MSWLYHVLVLIELILPSNSAFPKRTYGDLEFMSPGTQSSLSGAQSWCKQHGSTLAEITSEHIWNLTLMFVDEFRLNKNYIVLNAEGKELPAWQWITGETYQGRHSTSLKYDVKMYAKLTKYGEKLLPSRQVYRTAPRMVEMVTFVNMAEIQDAMFKVTIRPFSMIVYAIASIMTGMSHGSKRFMSVKRSMEGWLHFQIWIKLDLRLRHK